MRKSRSMFFVCPVALISLLVLPAVTFAHQAQAPAPPPAPQTPPPAAPAPQTPPGADPAQSDPKPATPPEGANRIFGVLPNYTSVEDPTIVKPVTNSDVFKMAALDSFDPMVYPLFGFVAGVNHLQNNPPEWGGGWPGYGRRYAAAFADNTVCSIITTGVMPSLLQQDPRYFVLGKGRFLYRVGYSASRSAVTHSRTGKKQLNISEIGGTLVVATISNLYYPSTQRNVSDTLMRWGTQAMWDTVSNEMKEFWPDIRHMLHGL
jgi:hypothetical protein